MLSGNPKLDKEQMMTCRRVDVPAFLFRQYGIELKSNGSTYSMVTDPSVAWYPPDRDRENIWRFHDFSSSNEMHGDVIDFITKYLNYRFNDALWDLARYAGVVPMRRNSEKAKIIDEKAPVKMNKVVGINLPKKGSDDKRAIAYLCSRKIDAQIVFDCIRRRSIYQDDKGNVVFVGRDREGQARYAYMRGTLTLGDPFKGEAKGSNKAYGFLLPGIAANDTVTCFESAIDALSYATVMKNNNKRYGDCLALGGVADKALVQYLMEHQDCKKIILRLDNDLAGFKGASAIAERFKKKYDVQVGQLPAGFKDMNDYLRGRKKEDDRDR